MAWSMMAKLWRLPGTALNGEVVNMRNRFSWLLTFMLISVLFYEQKWTEMNVEWTFMNAVWTLVNGFAKRLFAYMFFFQVKVPFRRSSTSSANEVLLISPRSTTDIAEKYYCSGRGIIVTWMEVTGMKRKRWHNWLFKAVVLTWQSQ